MSGKVDRHFGWSAFADVDISRLKRNITLTKVGGLQQHSTQNPCALRPGSRPFAVNPTDHVDVVEPG
ncbi:unnamed protein product [Gongylonema pulchrum]|uniref:Transposase n=1 Tax=Gongylonema pulchrum TaxID=637853 RepID=A0A183E204_9BILA|nr:unnamed protein product [Gongylonema pulchrum]